jgi:hypothetical protein
MFFAEAEHIFTISPCVSLRTLTLKDPSLRNMSHYTVTLLLQITSSVIEKISFHIRAHLDVFPLEKVEEILTGRMFSNVRAVVFWLYGDSAQSNANLKMRIMVRMKLLDSRGLLEFRTR